MNATPSGPSTRSRVIAFVALVAICAGAGIAYVLNARANDPRAGRPTQSTLPPSAATLSSIMQRPHVLFRNTDLGPDHGGVAVVPLADPTGPRVATPLHACDRVAMVGATGVCLASNVYHSSPPYGIGIFDASFKVRHDLTMIGTASRARVSPDGRYVASTIFVTGDSYAAAAFSTRTTIADAGTGKVVADLERFRVTDNGKVVKSVSRNYWGITFAADSEHFYATQGVGDDMRLIEGDITTKTAHTVARNVECPSLSPDQTRVAYKKRGGGALSAVRWRLHVLDLATGADHELAETRSVDDQAEWLDNQTVLYGLPRSADSPVSDIWRVPADGSGKASIFIPRASSPSVSRG